MKYGTCCPDLLDLDLKPDIDLIETLYSCTHAQLRLVNTTDVSGPLYTIYSKCPSSFEDTNLDDNNKCEGHIATAIEDFNLNDHVPVSSRSTMKTYRNMHCARCNGVARSDWVYWTPELSCSKQDDVQMLTSTSLGELIHRVYQNSLCNILFVPPNDVISQKCDNNVISSCNATGLWDKYDPLLEAGCAAYTSVYRHELRLNLETEVYSLDHDADLYSNEYILHAPILIHDPGEAAVLDTVVYRNVICFLCNHEAKVTQSNDLCVRTEVEEGNILPFTVVLDFNANDWDEPTDAMIDCVDGFRFDPYKV
jgi:hypothetical protein